MPSPIDCDLPLGAARGRPIAGLQRSNWNGSQHAPGSLEELTKSADGGAVHDVDLAPIAQRKDHDRSSAGRHVGR